MPWHTPDAKIEDALASLFAQVGGAELDGLTIQQRLALGTNASSVLRIACSALAEWEPNGTRPIAQSGNWSGEVQLRIRSKARKVSGATHDQYCGRVADLCMDADFVTALNDIARDNELQVLRARLVSKENDVDDNQNEYVSTFGLEVDLVPHITAPQPGNW